MKNPKRNVVPSRDGVEGTDAVAWPEVFRRVMEEQRHNGCLCVVSRVSQDVEGVVTHVEWGVIDKWLCDWLAGPQVAEVGEVLQAVEDGGRVSTLFATATGFARGPNVAVDHTRQFALERDAPAEWNVHMLARLQLARRLH
ncbi:hypothetical protein [Rhizobacter sp. Root1221]|uniref:hypothetical protein n=1 Tax=Rhizobacter sp. Root1221 TaxID=1736433 RepID=UPI000A8CA7FB|nr:hypothetical protein [Rhizobacter sp. Root1221]